MKRELFFRAIGKFAAGLLIVALLLFVPAWTLKYPQAWLLIAILFAPMFLAGFVMLAKNPELLKKRLNAKEQESEQREVIVLSGAMFLAAFVLAGLSFRFGWLMLPMPVSIAGSSGIPCTGQRCSCFWPCRWYWAPFFPSLSCCAISPSSSNGSGTRRRCWNRACPGILRTSRR